LTSKNKDGNTVEHGFNGHPERDRYFYDFGGGLPGDQCNWKQFDTSQDASYFGVWVNFETRQTFCYCEGDTTLVTCEDDEHFALQLNALVEFHGPPPAHIRSIDSDGAYHEHPLERPSLENPNPKGAVELFRELLS
jgi:hypothetical protein